ncbi:YjjI family glycine radical enzyme [Turicibacter bilis]|uniref:YjjI family glycine radical enzyme n=1 Tax=Turicibacter bilis TaxID=2735723 RepID=A0A9Q9CSF9_9FIRM|nr:YjjI family glycine radical enzyme [Turicibacter bilis]MBS3197273.1 YjjI family glycine radical enzyme [Turicibacter bilis]MBS3200890.1 YjjI family glycine radical enzyme [Turicibacter bilis]UUF05436.1 YjjI family glycine radical enzyme [Turicibacter bilis]UUF09112.1 YjjI family glycine radical enzyme [Turicibacter bilis]
MTGVEQIVKDTTLTFEQKVVALARYAENSVQVLNISEETQALRDAGIICDLFEGNVPYRPRYILPNYEKFMKEGCQFLQLDPPKNIWEATNYLLIFYKHVPSITTMPVYIGNIDYLLEPFITDEEEAKLAIRLFFTQLDRTITDSFCHANLGPKPTKAAKIILEVERELENAIPNLTLKYNEETPDDLAIEAIKTALVTAKPSFANHAMFTEDLGDYGIASCYNGLHVGGGAHTLVRMRLSKLAETATDIDDFFNNKLPHAMTCMANYINERIRYIVEESTFFETNFLVKEGFISKDRFTSMFGLVGLAECVNTLLKAEKLEDKFGHSQIADDLGVRIMDAMEDFINNFESKHCTVTNERLLLHAQVGIGDDINTSPGSRIPIGEEPELWKHLKQTARFHKYFPSGVGDIFPFELNAANNPEFILNIIQGAFKEGMRYFSLYSSDADVIRITGYLVKRSEIAKLDQGIATLQDTVVLGQGQVRNGKVYERKVR